MSWKNNISFIGIFCLAISLSACISEIKQRFNPQPKDQLLIDARAGDIDSQHALGKRYWQSGDYSRAIYWLCISGRSGHADAQYDLGRLYEGWASKEDGGTLSSSGSSYFWYTAAASQGHDLALSARERVSAGMAEKEILKVKRRATRWKQAGCIKP